MYVQLKPSVFGYTLCIHMNARARLSSRPNMTTKWILCYPSGVYKTIFIVKVKLNRYIHAARIYAKRDNDSNNAVRIEQYALYCVCSKFLLDITFFRLEISFIVIVGVRRTLTYTKFSLNWTYSIWVTLFWYVHTISWIHRNGALLGKSWWDRIYIYTK